MQIIAIKLVLNRLSDIYYDLHKCEPVKTGFRSSLPKLGKDEFGSRKAIPDWARTNLVQVKLTKVGQARICFQASYPNLGKGEFG